MAVQFQPKRQRLLSFSKDNVLRVWDTQLQVCIQKLAGIYPKSLDGKYVFLLNNIHGCFGDFTRVCGSVQMKSLTTLVYLFTSPTLSVVWDF